MKALQSIRNRLNQIERLIELQEEKGKNDIRRKLINIEIRESERELLEVRRNNQQ